MAGFFPGIQYQVLILIYIVSDAESFGSPLILTALFYKSTVKIKCSEIKAP